MENGRYAHYINNESHGDDIILTRVLSKYSVLDAVLDGVSMGNGKRGSQLTAEKLKRGVIENQVHLGEIVREANKELSYSATIGETTLTATLKIGNKLYVLNTGDSPAYLLRDKKVIELATLDKVHFHPAMITMCVGMGDKFNYHSKQIDLQAGDKLILLTDGITDNIYVPEIVEIMGERTPKIVVKSLERLMNRKRSSNRGRQDVFNIFKNDDASAIVRFF